MKSKPSPVLVLPALVILLLATLSLPQALGAQVRPSTAEFASLDAAVRKIGKPRTIEALASRLAPLVKTDWQKARAIYVWVTDNIAYDAKSFFAGTDAVVDPQGVFASGKSVCQGYSDLYKNLADRLGLSCDTVTGYAKGYGYAQGQTFDRSNHAWNIVVIDGKTAVLIDTTWGAGSVDGKNFNKKFTDSMFALDPHLFVLTHLPEDPDFQLLRPAVTMKDWLDSPYVPSWAVSAMTDLGLDYRQQFALINKGDLDFISSISLYRDAGFSAADVMAIADIKHLPEDFWFFSKNLIALGYPGPDIVAVAKAGKLPKSWALPGLAFSDLKLPLTAEMDQELTLGISSAGIKDIALIEDGNWLSFEKKANDFSLVWTPSGKHAEIWVTRKDGKQDALMQYDIQP